MFATEGIYLFCPIAACSAVLLLNRDHDSQTGLTDETGVIPLWTLACIAASIPCVFLLLPYLLHDRMWDFVYGAFILPRKRLDYASFAMPPAAVLVIAVPLMGLVLPVRQAVFGRWSSLAEALMWIGGIILPLWSIRNIVVYELIWESTRGFAALLPVIICYRLVSGTVHDTAQRTVLFMTATMLAWMSLNQFPFGSPIYFSHVTPLAVVAGVALANSSGSLRPRVVLPWTLMVLVFAIFNSNPSYVEAFGIAHVRRHFDTALNLPGAHLSLEAQDVNVYRRTVSLIEQHLHGGRLVAGPDSPELYYLTATRNESGRLFEFFSDPDPLSPSAADEWSKGQVIVLNHRPAFSTRPKPALVTQLRTNFPQGEQIGKFEVRWR